MEPSGVVVFQVVVPSSMISSQHADRAEIQKVRLVAFKLGFVTSHEAAHAALQLFLCAQLN